METPTLNFVLEQGIFKDTRLFLKHTLLSYVSMLLINL